MIDEETGLRVELHVTGKALEVYGPTSGEFLEFILATKDVDFSHELRRIAAGRPGRDKNSNYSCY